MMPTPLRPVLRRALPVLPLTIVIAVVLAGCGSSDNGVASKSASEILAASKAAVASASSVHVAGQNSQGPLKLTINLDLGNNGGRGQISLLSLSFEVIRIGDTLYVKGNPAFTQRVPGAAHLPPGTWLKLPASGGQLAQLATFTQLGTEVKQLISSGNPITKGATTTINGQKAIELKQTAKLYTGSIYVAATGKPYPIQIVKHGRETGQIILTNWNKPIALTPPPNAIAVSQLEHTKR